MYILGIFNDHNASACLMKDGKILGLLSEERFNRKKNFRGFPEKSIEYLLKTWDLKPKDIDIVTSSYLLGALVFLPNTKLNQEGHRILNFCFRFATLLQKLISFIQHLPGMRKLYRKAYFITTRLFNNKTLQLELEFLAKELHVSKEKITPRNHHLSHAAAAYFSSPFREEKSLVFTADGGGEGICASVDLFNRHECQSLAKTDATHSLGMIFYYLTSYLGMKPLEHEYKIMGLAPYAKSSHGDNVYNMIADWITLDPQNSMKFTSPFDTHYSYRYIEKTMKGQRFDNVAYAFQKLLEERVVEWIQKTIRITNVHTVCVGGGIFMNVKLNMLLEELPEIEKLYVLPSCGDESTVLGACYLSYLDWCKKHLSSFDIEGLTNIYLGPKYENDEILTLLKTTSFSYEYIESIEEIIAELLSQEKIVAVLRGNMEFGARALGNRSILADPSKQKLVKIINDQVKKRDFWMPFAPTILEERMEDYLVNPKKIQSPFMMMAFHTTPLAQKHFPGALHPYDFTMRPQILTQKANPSYYKIIKAFERITGIGGVLNTSFNLHGLPIVLSPSQALDDFRNSHLEYLVLENYLVKKKIV